MGTFHRNHFQIKVLHLTEINIIVVDVFDNALIGRLAQHLELVVGKVGIAVGLFDLISEIFFQLAENKNVLDRIDVVNRLLRDVFFFFLFFTAACKKKAQQK